MSSLGVVFHDMGETEVIKAVHAAVKNGIRAVINCVKSGNYDIKLFIANVVKPEEAESAMKEWSVNPGKVFRIIVEF